MIKSIFLLLGLLIGIQASAQVYVRGYYRKDGTYVRPHYRSKPDGNPYNNWSYPGNVNPYTGKKATGSSETYLRNYYKYKKNSNSHYYRYNNYYNRRRYYR